LTGDTLFETDTKNIIVYDGTAWRGYANDGVSYTLSSTNMSVDFTKTGNTTTNNWLQTNYQTTSDTGFTFSAWIKSNVTDSQRIFDNYTTSHQLALRVLSGNYALYYYAGGTSNTIFNTSSHSASGVFDGNWRHLAVTLAGTTAKIYEEGALKYTETFSDTYTAIASNFRIGANLSNSDAYAGLMDEVAFFERALTATEVLNQYNNHVYLSPTCHFRMGDGPSDTDSSGAATAGEDVETITDVSGNGYTATQSTATKKPVYSSDVPSF
jgi:hypothetical protein